MNWVSRMVANGAAATAAARSRFPAVDHLCRAALRYDQLLGGRLAAAIAYYGFFAVFALGLVAYSVFGFLLTYDVELLDQVQAFLDDNLPFLDAAAIRESRRTVGVVGLVGLVLTGIGWVEAIRSSQRLVWGLDQQPGNVVVRHLVDLAVMVGLLLMMMASVLAVDALESLLAWLADGRLSAALTGIGWALTLVVNMVLGAGLLVAVPRLRMTPRRLAPPVLLVGVGLTLLNTVGRSLVSYAQGRPAYALAGGAVGLLIYLYVFNQLLLFGAALAATSRHGRVRDLSHRRRPLVAALDRPVDADRVAEAAWPAGPGRAVVAKRPLSGGRGGDDGAVGALVTLALPDGSPVRDLPWIITIGPLSEHDEWEPVVVGPYEREHALALAESVVAEDELLAAVEPLLPLASVAAIRDEVATVRAAAEQEPAFLDDDLDEDDGDPAEPHVPAAPPTEQEVRAGFARIAARLSPGERP